MSFHTSPYKDGKVGFIADFYTSKVLYLFYFNINAEPMICSK